MTWASAIRRQAAIFAPPPDEFFFKPTIPQHIVDWARLVSLDFETYYDDDYTLSKLSTSEYIRDPRFKAQMLGIKIGSKGKTRLIPPKKIRAELAKIDWDTHAVLAHNAQFDGFILSHHYGVHPRYIYDTLSMARGLHSNDIGAGLHEVSIFYGGQGKTEGGLEPTKGVFDWPPALFKSTSIYCANDVDEMFRIFNCMLPKMPTAEMDLIDITCRMFTSPVLKVDIPRVEKELERELTRRQVLMYAAVDPKLHDLGGKLYDKAIHAKLLKGPVERALTGEARDFQIIKRIIGSNGKFADMLRAEGVEPPIKVSPAWIKLPKDERETPEGLERKYTYAFAKDDTKFIELPNRTDEWGFDLNKPAQVKLMIAKQERLQALIDVRIAVKSTTNVTRAQRFLTAGANDMSLPCGYAYYRAHTGRMGGQNKMNMQNLTRGGELRLSILAPKGHAICVQDSGQIEARVNGWLWGQDDLMDAFRNADKWDKKTMGVATGVNRDAYCRFGDSVYGREITTNDTLERFVGKVCLGPDTIVLTNHGLKSIIEVRVTDLLWDGESWVRHEGLVDQGVRTTLTHRGLSATPDHEILTEHGWLEWQEVLTSHSLFQSALGSASLPSCDGSTTSPKTGSHGATAPSASARAGQSLWSMPAASRQAALRDATRALRSRQVPNATGSIGMLCRMTSIAHACSTVLRQQFRAVVTRAMRPISTMAFGASQSILAGFQTALSSCGMSELYLAGTGQSLSLTASKTTGGTALATSGSLPRPSTRQTNDELKTLNSASVISKQITPTYDLANAGPNHRFTVMSDDGPVVVHNCVLGLGFQMGGAKLQITLAKGALGGPPVYFSLDQCKAIINAYRLKNYRIVAGWEICKRIIEDMAAGRTGSHGPISWEKETIWLPNGMALKYPDLRKGINEDSGWDEWSYQAKDQRKKIYGGLLCENIVQALARIIVMSQMLDISRKYRVVMTTHDETVTISKLAAAPRCVAFMRKCMSTPLPWCLDIPLNCEGGFDVNYSK